MIEIKDIGFSYGEHTVLQNISMTFKEGCIYGLLGENGVGNPLLYIDDIIGCCLTFLLGAIVFQKSKSVKTFIAIIVITTALGMIL